MKENIRKTLLDAGAAAVGFARAGEISSDASKSYEKWVEEGCHGEMEYLRRHESLRKTTDFVLPEAQTVISLAFDFTPREWREKEKGYVSAYAYGKDYHNVLRALLKSVVAEFKQNYGGKWRVCIDSAPVAERYWAMRGGIGCRGLNGALIVDKVGPFCFLVEILTTLHLEPDEPSEKWCLKCGKCLSVCPSGALKGDGTMDARKCINYLTIEKMGEFSEEERESVRRGDGSLFGCDRCYRVCPMWCSRENRSPDTFYRENPYGEKMERYLITDFVLSDSIRNLTPEKLLAMDETAFNKEFKNSPLHYAGYHRLLRNAKALL